MRTASRSSDEARRPCPAQRHVTRICTFPPASTSWTARSRRSGRGPSPDLPNGTTVERLPENGAWPTADAATQAARADILHITCHGGIQDADWETVWTLNHQGLPFTLRHRAGRGRPVWPSSDEGPLVFGNARQEAGAGPATATGLTPGLAYSFLDKGAAAFVGTFAPITKTMALKFAAAFYGHLLGREPGRRRRAVAHEVRLQGGRRAGSCSWLDLLPLAALPRPQFVVA